MKHTELLTQMFNKDFNVTEKENIITGTAHFSGKEFLICGVVNEAPLGNTMSQQLAQFILEQITVKPDAQCIMLVDTAGQEATHAAELFGLNRYIAHLAKTIHVARSKGARFFGIVYGKALGGAFIATALNAERIYALETAQIAVMWLEAMSRVTKIPLEKLQALSKTSAIFAPGAENFVKLGAVEAILKPTDMMPRIQHDLLTAPPDLHQWRQHGLARGGRTMADRIVNDVLNA